MNEDNWFQEKIVSYSWDNQIDNEAINSIEFDIKHEIKSEKQEKESQTENIDDENLLNSIENQKLRGDVQMKSILRKIRKDMRTLFFETTSFNSRIRKNLLQHFMQSLEAFASNLFGENYSRKQILALGSLIYAKYMQQVNKHQCKIGEISEEEFNESMTFSNKVHQALYNFSESRLLELTLNEEFRDLIMIHSEIWGDEAMSECDRYFYNKITVKPFAFTIVLLHINLRKTLEINIIFKSILQHINY